MNEFMLDDQRRTSDNLLLARVLDDRDEIVATQFHSMKLAEKLRMSNITDARQLRKQRQEATIEIAFLQWTHHQPWFTRVHGCDRRIEFGNRFTPIQFVQQASVVQRLFTLDKWIQHFVITANANFCCRSKHFNFYAFINNGDCEARYTPSKCEGERVSESSVKMN